MRLVRRDEPVGGCLEGRHGEVLIGEAMVAEAEARTDRELDRANFLDRVGADVAHQAAASGHALQDLAAQAKMVGNRQHLDEAADLKGAVDVVQAVEIGIAIREAAAIDVVGGRADAQVLVFENRDVEGIIGRVERVGFADLVVADVDRGQHVDGLRSRELVGDVRADADRHREPRRVRRDEDRRRNAARQVRRERRRGEGHEPEARDKSKSGVAAHQSPS